MARSMRSATRRGARLVLPDGSSAHSSDSSQSSGDDSDPKGGSSGVVAFSTLSAAKPLSSAIDLEHRQLSPGALQAFAGPLHNRRSARQGSSNQVDDAGEPSRARTRRFSPEPDCDEEDASFDDASDEDANLK